MEQIAIAFTGVVAIWLTQDKRGSWRRYACLFGLAGQPFWFHSAWQSEQWGVFVLCVFYTFAWLKGFRVHWWKGEAKEKPETLPIRIPAYLCESCGSLNRTRNHPSAETIGCWRCGFLKHRHSPTLFVKPEILDL